MKKQETTDSPSNRKNVTIALSPDDKESIDDLKKDLKKKNITQVFNYLLDFYQSTHPKVHELEVENLKNKEDFNKRINQLEEQMQDLKYESTINNYVTLESFTNAINELSGNLTKIIDQIASFENQIKNIEKSINKNFNLIEHDGKRIKDLRKDMIEFEVIKDNVFSLDEIMDLRDHIIDFKEKYNDIRKKLIEGQETKFLNKELKQSLKNLMDNERKFLE